MYKASSSYPRSTAVVTGDGSPWMGRICRKPSTWAALQAATGEVLAHVGGRDFARSPFDRVSRARRQPGSVFKPFVAIAALGTPDGRRFTLDTILADEPLELEVEGRKWKPGNHDRHHRGPVTMRRALAESLNVPFVPFTHKRFGYMSFAT